MIRVSVLISRHELASVTQQRAESTTRQGRQSTRDESRIHRIISHVLALTLLLFSTSAGAQERRLLTFRDLKSGISFRYPADYLMTHAPDTKDDVFGVVLKKGESEILIDVKDLGDYPAEWRAQGRTTFVDAAVAIARLRCDAGGPDGERSCSDVLGQSTFANRSGLECVELQLREEIHTYEPVRNTIRTRGPIYAVRFPRPGLPLIIFFEFEPEYSPSAAEGNILAEIVNSVSAADVPQD